MTADRYSKQMILPEFGDDGQQKLEDASVLVVGAGGLGSTILYNLAAAGVGTIGIADPDIVTANNLNRQFIHFEEDIGSLKVNSACRKLREFNSLINIIPHATALNKDNAYEIIAQYDVVAMAVNNNQAKMIINEACVELDIPFSDGNANGFVGTASFCVPHKDPCLACLYGTTQPADEAFGTVGSVVSTIAGMETTNIIQYLLGLPVPLEGKLLCYDASAASIETVTVEFQDNCPVCGAKAEPEE